MEATSNRADTALLSCICIGVFVEKYHRCEFDIRAIDVLRGIFADVCSDAHAMLMEMDVEDDHVHLLVEHPPKVLVASLVNSL